MLIFVKFLQSAIFKAAVTFIVLSVYFTVKNCNSIHKN